MENKIKIRRFYEELGKLLYAVALGNQRVREIEVIKLREFVSDELADLNPMYDSSGMKYAFYTIFEFKDCIENHLSFEEARDSFMNFLSENIDYLDLSLIEKIIIGIEKIENAYKKKSKKEKEIIEKIKLEIHEIFKFRLNNTEEILFV